MKQMSLATSGFELSPKRTRKRAFLDEMDAVIPWLDRGIQANLTSAKRRHPAIYSALLHKILDKG